MQCIERKISPHHRLVPKGRAKVTRSPQDDSDEVQKNESDNPAPSVRVVPSVSSTMSRPSPESITNMFHTFRITPQHVTPVEGSSLNQPAVESAKRYSFQRRGHVGCVSLILHLQLLLFSAGHSAGTLGRGFWSGISKCPRGNRFASRFTSRFTTSRSPQPCQTTERTIRCHVWSVPATSDPSNTHARSPHTSKNFPSSTNSTRKTCNPQTTSR